MKVQLKLKKIYHNNILINLGAKYIILIAQSYYHFEYSYQLTIKNAIAVNNDFRGKQDSSSRRIHNTEKCAASVLPPGICNKMQYFDSDSAT